MNLSSPIFKNIAIVLVIGVIGFFGYNYLIGSSSSAGDLTQVSQTSTSKMGAQVLSALNQLSQLKLDESVFSDATFKSLRDFSQPLPTDQVPGRTNPFAPIGASVSSGASTGQTFPSQTTAPKTTTTTTKTVSQ